MSFGVLWKLVASASFAAIMYSLFRIKCNKTQHKNIQCKNARTANWLHFIFAAKCENVHLTWIPWHVPLGTATHRPKKNFDSSHTVHTVINITAYGADRTKTPDCVVDWGLIPSACSQLHLYRDWQSPAERRIARAVHHFCAAGST